MFFLICEEMLRDETVRTASVFGTEEAALASACKIANGFAGRVCTFRLFRAGEEITLEENEEEERVETVTRARRFISIGVKRVISTKK